MASTPKWYDRVMAVSTTTGTGTYTLGSTVTGFQAWSAVGDGNSAYYCAQEVDANGNPSGDWEVGLGTYTTSGTTLSRDTILASTNANAAVSWAAGTRRIFLTVPASETPSLDGSIMALLRGMKAIPVLGSNLSLGDTDLYTVPTGRRALIMGPTYFNGSAGTVNFYTQVKIAGTYYRLTTLAAPGTGTGSSVSSVDLLEAGDILSINCATTAGLNASYAVIEFDATSSLKQGRLVGLSSGDNTVYTCPAGKTAVAVTPRFGNFNTAHGSWLFMNDAGGAHDIIPYLVPSGGSPGSTNKIAATANVAASTRTTSIGFFSFGAGDFFSLNVSVGAASQYAAIFVVER